MLNFNPETDLWEYLKSAGLPIVLYGMGDGAEKILKVCGEYNINISGVFATEVKRERYFHQWRVLPIESLEKSLGEKLIILIAFGTSDPEIIEFIAVLKQKHEVYSPDVPVTGGGLFNRSFVKENLKKIKEVYNLWEDDFSRFTYENIIKAKLTGKTEYLDNHIVTRKEMFRLFPWGQNEVFVDAGAYRGDTIEEFISMTGGEYSQIFALEPDGKNYEKLRRNLMGKRNISIQEAAAWGKNELLYFQPRSGRSGRLEKGAQPNTRGVKVDDVAGNYTVSYIKYDVEGAEKEAIFGSEKTIKKSCPKLVISAYHRPEDLFELPLIIKEMVPEYKFYLRRNEGYPAWDINLMCVKE